MWHKWAIACTIRDPIMLNQCISFTLFFFSDKSSKPAFYRISRQCSKCRKANSHTTGWLANVCSIFNINVAHHGFVYIQHSTMNYSLARSAMLNTFLGRARARANTSIITSPVCNAQCTLHIHIWRCLLVIVWQLPATNIWMCAHVSVPECCIIIDRSIDGWWLISRPGLPCRSVKPHIRWPRKIGKTTTATNN